MNAIVALAIIIVGVALMILAIPPVVAITGVAFDKLGNPIAERWIDYWVNWEMRHRD